MKKKKRPKRVYAPALKAAAVARVMRGRKSGKETQRQIAADLGIAESVLSHWVARSGKSEPSRAARVRAWRAAKPAPNGGATAKPAPNGATAASDDAGGGPTIELRNLRAWVNHAVRLEFDRLVAAKGLDP